MPAGLRRYTLSLVLALLLPAAAAAIPASEARHLLVRTGFAATPSAIEALKDKSREQAVDQLLAGVRTTPTVAPPAWTQDKVVLGEQTKPAGAARKARRLERTERGSELKSWWVREMRATDSPLTERLVLFWHNHFTSGLAKVKEPTLMARQNLLLRRHALGNFRTLAQAMARDPAMLIYLDGRRNREGNPNENFARELLELFTLGEGHYSEQDIKEAARAFTGWRLDRDDATRAVFQAKAHDNGRKRFMGREGNFDGAAIIDIVLSQPRSAEYLVERLWREFISPSPDPAAVRRLAAVLRGADYELRPLLRALLLDPAFFAAANRGVLLKSPVDLLLGTARQLDLPLGDGRALAEALRRLGQDLLDPPNVKGWPGGTTWITSATLVRREQALGRLLQGLEMGAAEPAQTLTELADLLLPIAPVDPHPADARGRDALLHLVRDPAYQLK